MVHPAGVEPAAYGIGIRHSIQLSYGAYGGTGKSCFHQFSVSFNSFQHSQFPAAYSTAFFVFIV